MTLAGLKQRPAYFLYRFLWNALDWVFPPRCAGCDRFGERWCSTCASTLIPLPQPVCMRCGMPIPTVPGAMKICGECEQLPPAYAALRSVCLYKDHARKAVHKLKYGRDIGIGDSLSVHMIALVQELVWPIQLVTCVPLSRIRRRERGYNQAAALARPVALGLHLPFLPLLLRKKREIPSQVGLSHTERRRNVEDAFETGGTEQIGKNILLVDDVTTTGSTMNACARALMDAGARQVFGLTFARAGLSDHNTPV